jgi:hypothetical protein
VVVDGYVHASGYGKWARLYFIAFNLIMVCVMMNIFAGSFISCIHSSITIYGRITLDSTPQGSLISSIQKVYEDRRGQQALLQGGEEEHDDDGPIAAQMSTIITEWLIENRTEDGCPWVYIWDMKELTFDPAVEFILKSSMEFLKPLRDGAYDFEGDDEARFRQSVMQGFSAILTLL